MYTVRVRDHFMIAHSFKGEVYGPAQRLHGATYVVDVEFLREELDEDGLVVDIGRASHALNEVLSGLNYRNLDEDPGFEGENTSSEFMARVVFDRMVEKIARGSLGAGATSLVSMKVTLNESHVASASYQAEL
ncbi:MAG: 6-carboxytetrahydropterin synthase [Rhodospirillaceae bacterium]|nr:6-carboxytetrahydropterin synthase [Rhodospirillaceae bacterium]